MPTEPERQVLLQVLAADFCCRPEDFLRPEVVVTEVEDRPGRRRFPLRTKTLSVATTGRGIVICCDRDRLEWARANLSRLSNEDLFAAPAIARIQGFVERDGQMMAGPDLKFICTRGDFEPACGSVERGVDIELYSGNRIRNLYQ